MVEADEKFLQATGQVFLTEEVGMGGPSSKEIDWVKFYRMAQEQQDELSELMKASKPADLRTRGFEI